MQFSSPTAWEPAGEKHSWNHRQDRVPILRPRGLSYHGLQQPVEGKKSVSEPLILVWRKMVLLSHCMNMGHVEFCQVPKAAKMVLHSPGKAYTLTLMCMRTSEKQVNTDVSFGSAHQFHGTRGCYKPCCAQASCICGRVAEV